MYLCNNAKMYRLNGFPDPLVLNLWQASFSDSKQQAPFIFPFSEPKAIHPGHSCKIAFKMAKRKRRRTTEPMLANGRDASSAHDAGFQSTKLPRTASELHHSARRKQSVSRLDSKDGLRREGAARDGEGRGRTQEGEGRERGALAAGPPWPVAQPLLTSSRR